MSSSEYSNLDDFSLVKKTRDGDGTALMELSGRHSGIYYDMLNKTGWGLTACEKSDLIEEKDSFIYEVAGKFKEDRGMKFSSFLGQMTTWKVKKMRSRAKEAPLFVSDQILEKKTSTQFQEEDYNKLMDAAFNCNDKATNEIMRMKADGKSFDEIAAEIGFSSVWARFLYRKGMKNIKERYLGE